MPPTSKAITPVKIGEDRYISFSMGALWAMAGAVLIGLGLMIATVREGQQFLDSFDGFKSATLAYQKGAEYHNRVIDVKLDNVASWQLAADQRRKITLPTLVNITSLDQWARELARINPDILHADRDNRGLTVPGIVVKPLENLPEATILPLPPMPRGLDPTQ